MPAPLFEKMVCLIYRILRIDKQLDLPPLPVSRAPSLAAVSRQRRAARLAGRQGTGGRVLDFTDRIVTAQTLPRYVTRLPVNYRDIAI